MTQRIAQPEDTTNAEVEVIEFGSNDYCIPAASSTCTGKEEMVLSKSQNGTSTSGTNLNNPHRNPESATANPRPLNKQDNEKTFITSPSSDSNGALAIPRPIPTIGKSHSGNSLDTNLSVEPASFHGPPFDSNRQQISRSQNPVTRQGPERGNMENSRQPSETPLSQQRGGKGGGPPLQTRPNKDYTSLQQSDNIPEQKDDYQGKKNVFILHCVPENDLHGNGSLLSFATTLRDSGINVSIDLFEKDNSNDNWSMWCEREILNANVVLCVITPNFYKSITEHDRIKGLALYSSMSDSTKDIAFRAVFLDSVKIMEYVPLSMRGATCYCISSGNLSVEDEEFASLYAFLTGQNRIEKPKLGKVIKLAPKKSRFGQVRSQHPPINRDAMYHQRSPFIASQPSNPQKNDQANLIFQLLNKDTTQVKSLSYQRMFATLAKNMTAKWEVLARMLDLRENDLFYIKSDYRDSVQEQAVQMFHKWLENNGSAATLGGLTTAVYESGSAYWNLLDIVNKYAPK